MGRAGVRHRHRHRDRRQPQSGSARRGRAIAASRRGWPASTTTPTSWRSARASSATSRRGIASQVFFSTAFEGGRHERRVAKLGWRMTFDPIIEASTMALAQQKDIPAFDRSLLRRSPRRGRSGDRGGGAGRARPPARPHRADRVGEHRFGARCSRRRARCSPTNTPRAIPAAATTAAASTSTSPRPWRSSAPSKLFGCALRQRAAAFGRPGQPGRVHGAADSRATRSWACRCRPAAI